MSLESVHAEPTLIDEEFLQHAIHQQINPVQSLHFSGGKEDQIHFNEVIKLHLHDKNILVIDNLWSFTALTRLDLNNNLIEKIQGLDYLINLTWLNLSFNRIEKIEGLEFLQQLEVLNLSNNRITVIENMDTLENLTHFFISNNLIEELENVLYLRRFKNLFELSVFGNPFPKEDDYKYFIAAYFPELMFLDFRSLDQNTKKEASTKYLIILEKTRLEELQIQQAEEAQQSHEAELKLLKDAFVDFLNGPCLVKSMFKDNSDAQTQHGEAFLSQTFEHHMGELCKQLLETGLAERKRRETETNSFYSSQKKAVSDYQDKASQMLAKVDQKHKKWMEELQQLPGPEECKVKINQCYDEINQLCQSLMTAEFQLVSVLENNTKTFDACLSDMIEHFSKTAQEIFSQCRDLENDYYDKMQNEILDKGAEETLKEDALDDDRMLEDRDRAMAALAAGHEYRLQKIKERETQLIAAGSAWKKTFIERIQDKELYRDRTNRSGILRYVDYLREQLEKFIL